MCRACWSCFLAGLCFFSSSGSFAADEETLPTTQAEVRVREHPKTGIPYVSIVDSENPDRRNPFSSNVKIYRRPDYRMLARETRAGEISYDGPSSSSKKIYLFAASLAAGGVLAGTLAPAAAAGTAASGSAAGPLIGSTAVTASAGSAALVSRTEPKKENLIQRAEARWLEQTGRQRKE